MPLKNLRSLAVALLVVATAACAPLQVPTGPGAPVGSARPVGVDGASQQPKAGGAEEQESSRTAPKAILPAHPVINPAQAAVSSLLQEAWGYYRAANYQRAIAIAERAQRLDAQRGEVYLVLASNYFALGQYHLAEQLSQRGLSFSQHDLTLRRKLQNLIQKIRSV